MKAKLCKPHGRLRCDECAYIEELKEQIQELQQTNAQIIKTADVIDARYQELIKILEWYADGENYEEIEITPVTLYNAVAEFEIPKVLIDKGERARQFLQTIIF